jgi:hypothetical protein
MDLIMTKLTDSELQALVFQTGITPCDRLPKPDPRYELNALLSDVSTRINGAVKAEQQTVVLKASGFPTYKAGTVLDAVPVLEQLGYVVVVKTADTQITITISGWI